MTSATLVPISLLSQFLYSFPHHVDRNPRPVRRRRIRVCPAKCDYLGREILVGGQSATNVRPHVNTSPASVRDVTVASLPSLQRSRAFSSRRKIRPWRTPSALEDAF